MSTAIIRAVPPQGLFLRDPRELRVPSAIRKARKDDLFRREIVKSWGGYRQPYCQALLVRQTHTCLPPPFPPGA